MASMDELEMELPVWGDDPHVLWDNYLRYARSTGKSGAKEQARPQPKAEQKAFSFWWLFAKYKLEDFPNALLARAFLGDRDAWERLKADCAQEAATLRCDPADFLGLPPNEEQWRAIKTALNSPISFIQGPPGTGKTATILNLIYQIAKQDTQKTVAIVSANNSALENIHDALKNLADKAKPEDRPKADGLARRLAQLGSKNKRETFYTDHDLPHKTKSVYFVQDKEDAPIRRKPENWPENERGAIRKAVAALAEGDPPNKGAAAWLNDLDALEKSTSDDKSKKLRRLLLHGWSMAHPTGTYQRVNWEAQYSAGDFFRLAPKGRKRDSFPHPGFAAFTSTVNSLPLCFNDGLDGSLFQYDYVIVDETSQMGLIPGLVTMLHAKHLVLVGDEQQLAPVVDEKLLSKMHFIPYGKAEIPSEEEERELEKLHPEWYEVLSEEEEAQWKQDEQANREWYDTSLWKNYYPDSEWSFLDLCLDVFLGRMKGGKRTGGLCQEPFPKVFLSRHYRCHPAIIQFCNEAVYIPAGTPLIVPHEGHHDQEFPIKALLFDGDYCERCYLGEEPGVPPKGKRPQNTSKYNRKQIEIFMEEEWPGLAERLQKEESLSVCILSPFEGQRAALEKTISATGIKIAEEKAEDGVTPMALTIHKSQGQEFDIVYLLPVEDGAWEWPFSQKKRMVNVAVSRAKKELRIIASTKFMTTPPKKRAGSGQKASSDDEELYVKKLIDYVKKNVTPEARNQGFGDQPTCLVSLFDKKEQDPDGQKCIEDSAGELCLDAFLKEAMPQLGITWTGEPKRDREVSIRSVLEEFLGDGSKEDERFQDFWDYISQNARFDCVIRHPKTGLPILAIEVDGQCHRFPWKSADAADLDTDFERWGERCRRDRIKDDIVRAMGGAVYYGNRRGQEAEQAECSSLPFALLRLPDDGSTFLETDALRDAAIQRGKVGKRVADKVFTIQDLLRKLLADETEQKTRSKGGEEAE